MCLGYRRSEVDNNDIRSALPHKHVPQLQVAVRPTNSHRLGWTLENSIDHRGSSSPGACTSSRIDERSRFRQYPADAVSLAKVEYLVACKIAPIEESAV